MSTQAEDARTQMIAQQVRAWAVLDPAVLDVLAAIPRERFVPSRYVSVAFADTTIPLGHGQCMMTPQVEGRLLQALRIRPEDRVLEIGTGSGFLTACLATMAAEVESLEIFPDLAARAGENLVHSGLRNCRITAQDAFDFAPDKLYDVIAVTGSLPGPEYPFRDWLSVGGRLFVISGREPIMEASLIRRRGDNEWTAEGLFETVIPPLLCTAGITGFAF